MQPWNSFVCFPAAASQWCCTCGSAAHLVGGGGSWRPPGRQGTAACQAAFGRSPGVVGPPALLQLVQHPSRQPAPQAAGLGQTTTLLSGAGRMHIVRIRLSTALYPQACAHAAALPGHLLPLPAWCLAPGWQATALRQHLRWPTAADATACALSQPAATLRGLQAEAATGKQGFCTHPRRMEKSSQGSVPTGRRGTMTGRTFSAAKRRPSALTRACASDAQPATVASLRSTADTCGRCGQLVGTVRASGVCPGGLTSGRQGLLMVRPSRGTQHAERP